MLERVPKTKQAIMGAGAGLAASVAMSAFMLFGAVLGALSPRRR